MRPFNVSMLAAQNTVEIVTIDVVAAKELVALNQGNRALGKSRVYAYAKAMTDGFWTLSPDAIVVERGMLRNGQHRLAALLQAQPSDGLPFILAVNCAMPFDTMDNGKARTATDILGLALGDEAPYPGALATVAKYIIRNDGVPHRYLTDNRRIELFVMANPQLLKIVTFCEETRRSPSADMPPSATHAIASNWFTIETYGIASNDELRDWAYSTLTGIGIDDPDEPLAVARRQVIRNLAGPTRSKYALADYAALFARAFTAAGTGRIVKTIRTDHVEWRDVFRQHRTLTETLTSPATADAYAGAMSPEDPDPDDPATPDPE